MASRTYSTLAEADVIRVWREGHQVLARVERPNGKTLPLTEALAHTRGLWDYGNESLRSRSLAWTILRVCTTVALANRYYRQWSSEAVEPESDDEWSIRVSDVRRWVRNRDRWHKHTPWRAIRMHG